MSGLEALYWEQHFPTEVESIIGLDMAVPESYENFTIKLSTMKLAILANNLGITRWIPSLAESDAIKYGTLTEQEKEITKAIFYRRTLTKPMINEAEKVLANANIVKEGNSPNIPMLLFSSNGKGTSFDPMTWRKIHTDYIDKIEVGELVYIDAPHYLHAIEYESIAQEIKRFIGALKDS